MYSGDNLPVKIRCTALDFNSIMNLVYTVSVCYNGRNAYCLILSVLGLDQFQFIAFLYFFHHRLYGLRYYNRIF